MLVLLLVLLAAAAACAQLGVWQLDRAQARGELAAQREAATAQGVPAVPLDSVLAPQTSFDGDLLGREVVVTGTYEPDGQLLVTDRSLDGRDGYLVLTPLRVATADGARPVLPVVRGWVASPDDAGDAGDVPGGTVMLTGYLQASEAAGVLDAAAGRTQGISSAQLVNEWGGPTYSGYLVLATSSPAQDRALRALDRPEPPDEGGLDLRNLGYALQWWIFGAFAVALWLRLVRDEARGEPPLGEDPVGEPPLGEDPVGEPPLGGDPAGAPPAPPDRRPAVTGQAGADAST